MIELVAREPEARAGVRAPLWPSLPEWSQVRLENGLSVSLLGLSQRTSCYLGLSSPLGALADPDGKEGLAALSAVALSDRLHFIIPSPEVKGDCSAGQSRFAVRAEWAGTLFSLEASPTDFERASSRWLSSLCQCDFVTEESVERGRATCFRWTAQEADRAPLRATRCLAHLLYGEGPYGRSMLGTPRSLASIAKADVKDFLERCLQSAGTRLVLVGARPSADLSSWVKREFSVLPRTSIARPGSIWTPEARARRRVLVDHRTGDAAYVLVGKIVIPREVHELHRLRVVVTILGGGLRSRLSRRLRGQMGIVYQINASLEPRYRHGLFVVSMAVSATRIVEAVRAALDEIRALATQPILQSEMVAAHNRLSGFLHRATQTSRGLASLARLRVDARSHENRQVSGEALRQMAATHLAEEGMTVVIAGRQRSIQHQLEALGEWEVAEVVGEGRVSFRSVSTGRRDKEADDLGQGAVKA